MKTAEQHLKAAFPDWRDWPEWSVEAQVKVMQDYAREVAQQAISKLEIVSVSTALGEKTFFVNPENEIETP